MIPRELCEEVVISEMKSSPKFPTYTLQSALATFVVYPNDIWNNIILTNDKLRTVNYYLYKNKVMFEVEK